MRVKGSKTPLCGTVDVEMLRSLSDHWHAMILLSYSPYCAMLFIVRGNNDPWSPPGKNLECGDVERIDSSGRQFI